MNSWLDEFRHALDASQHPVTFFFRDDDAGWRDDLLFELLDLFARYSMPIDLAAIPTELTSGSVTELRARLEAAPDMVAIHQHGFAHLNHEREGRKCEFGVSRARELQRYDIETGRERLAGLFGALVRPIFTPPWNRCTAVTGECLRQLGFRALSRDATATPLDIEGLLELPVTIDWFASRKNVRLSLDELGTKLAATVKATIPVGIMFHHAQMDAGERQSAGELLALLASHPNARCFLMDVLIDGLSPAHSAHAFKQIGGHLQIERQPSAPTERN